MQYFQKFIFVSLGLFFHLFCFGANMQTPEGWWVTIDDKTQRPKGWVEIVKNQTGELEGYIRKILFYDEFERKHKDKGCARCPGDYKNKPIAGLNFLRYMKKTKKEVWDKGRILDPRSGRIYRCKMTLSKNGKELAVRGYIGIPLLGRSQKWIRLDDEEWKQFA